MILSKEMDLLPDLFVDNPDAENLWLFIHGKINNQRVQKYIKSEYVVANPYIATYNVLMAKAIGSGHFGEVLSTPIVANTYVIATDTFISIGQFKTKREADNLCAYLMTKFLRAMLGVKKVTQDNPKSVWCFIPLQDFTDKSDIDWHKTIGNIDQQLYQKYGLSQEEVDFIEKNVKEMK